MTPLSPELVSRCRAVLNEHARTFSLAGKLLPPKVLDRAAVVYAFCRLIDDTVDEATDVETARRDLEVLRRELDGRAAARPVVQGYLQICTETGIPSSAADELMQGVLGDLGPVHLSSDGELVRYGYRVAGTVGLMMCGVLGVKDRRAWAHAIDLGVAMQITNICRDVLEDAHRGRIYLPQSRLEQAGIEDADLEAEHIVSATAETRQRLRRVVLDLLDLADRYYESADRGMYAIPWVGRAAIVVAARVYRGIGVVLRGRGGDTLAGRAYVPWWGKVQWTLRALMWVVARSWNTPRHHEEELHGELRGLPAIDAAKIPALGRQSDDGLAVGGVTHSLSNPVEASL